MCRGQNHSVPPASDEELIKKIQKSLGLPETGVADEATISSLLERMEQAKPRQESSEESSVEIDWEGWQIP